MNFSEVYLARILNPRVSKVVGTVHTDGDSYCINTSQLHAAFENALGLPIFKSVFTEICRRPTFELYADGDVSVTFLQEYRDPNAIYFGNDLVGHTQSRWTREGRSGPNIIARIERSILMPSDRGFSPVDRQSVLTNNFLDAFRTLLPKQGPTHTPS